MPLTTSQSKPALGIAIDGANRSFRPGDTITGRVYRKTSTANPQSYVTLQLCGREKAKAIEKDNDSGRTLRGRFSLLGSRYSLQKLSNPRQSHDGKQVTQEWPFTITIPLHVEREALPKVMRLKDYYKAIDEDSISKQTLLASFKTSADTGDAWMTAFIEYFIQAKLPPQDDVTTWHVSTEPIRIVHSNPDPPNYDDRMTRLERRLVVETQLLTPGMQGGKLSFGQKMKKALGSGKIPRATFRVETSVPTVMQLGRREHVPLRVRVVPIWEATSELVQNVPQKVHLVAVEYKLKGITEAKCEAEYENKGDYPTGMIWRQNLDTGNTDYEIPFDPKGADIWLDVGKLFNARLQKGGGPWDQSSSPLSPDFVSYILRHSHTLEYKLRIQIAGEVVKVHEEQKVRILAPSDAEGQGLDG